MMNITLTCTPLTYYTDVDEALCFKWIEKIKCIKNIKGIGKELHLSISVKTISDQDLLNLIGLFDRYKFSNPKQLEIFKNEQNKNWFS